MATQFTISGSESDASEEVEGYHNHTDQSSNVQEHLLGHSPDAPELSMADVSMAPPCHFTISGSELDVSEEVEGYQTDQSSNVQEHLLGNALTTPDLRVAASGRLRLNSESHASTVARDEELQARAEEEDGAAGDGTPFRGRSQSAPPALWAAQKYGRQLRRMSDEFDSLLDKGKMKRVQSTGSAPQMQHSKSWWNYLFSHQESDGESSHHENHNPRTE